MRLEVPFNILNPLILETAKKATQTSDLKCTDRTCYTDDKLTIEQHLDLLKKDNHKDIYSVLSNSIQKTHGKKL